VQQSVLISIAIPVYEMYGDGSRFLNESLQYLSRQTYRELEVVISDHSQARELLEVAERYADKLNIVYEKNDQRRGSSSANLNHALRLCRGEIVKILMQDEFLHRMDALNIIAETYQREKFSWLANGCLYGPSVNEVMGRMAPVYDDQSIVRAVNTVGSPSVLTIRNENIEFFNEELLWVMDCDYYKRLYLRHGLPHICSEPLVFVTQHPNQVTNKLSDERKRTEEQWLRKTYQ
jgi:glycosyltransferase involved in cell wall biosynthesis